MQESRRYANNMCRAMRVPLVSIRVLDEGSVAANIGGLYDEDSLTIELAFHDGKTPRRLLVHELAHHVQYWFGMSERPRKNGGTIRGQHGREFLLALLSVLCYFKIPVTRYGWHNDWKVVTLQAKPLITDKRKIRHLKRRV